MGGGRIREGGLRGEIEGGGKARAGPGKGPGRGGGRPHTVGLGCSLPGLSCPMENKTRKKRNVNFQKAVNEKCELWMPAKLLSRAQEGCMSWPLCS